jgi:hypothetical protein
MRTETRMVQGLVKADIVTYDYQDVGERATVLEQSGCLLSKA